MHIFKLIKNKVDFMLPTRILTLGVLAMVLGSCEENVEVDLPEKEESLVIESHIENGLPPYAILTKDQPYFKEISEESLNDLFVKNVDTCWITNFEDTMAMQKVNPRSLPPEIREVFIEVFRVSESDFRENLELVVYLPDFTSDDFFTGEVGGRYKLYVKTPDHEASATTTITRQARLDSSYYEIEGSNDDYAQVFIEVDDPKGEPYFYRYLTKRNDEPFYAPAAGSVASDNAVDGTTFKFPINRGYPRAGAEPSGETFGLFELRDTVIVKFCALDEEHYNYWSTLEQDLRNRGNPFGSPTIIQSNVDGGLGIFGGYSCDYDTVVISK